jgi:hypothetical protein
MERSCLALEVEKVTLFAENNGYFFKKETVYLRMPLILPETSEHKDEIISKSRKIEIKVCKRKRCNLGFIGFAKSEFRIGSHRRSSGK